MVRTCPTPPRMLVFDRRVAVVPIDPADTKRGAICISEAGVVASMVALFEQTWHSAVPLGADRSKDARTGLSTSEQELLTLLASGLTDEVRGGGSASRPAACGGRCRGSWNAWTRRAGSRPD